MCRIFIVILCVFWCSLTQANDYGIAQRAMKTPDNVSNSVHSLTRYLVEPYDNDYDKLKVIAYWIASHIAYDSYKFNNGQVNRKEAQLEYDVLKARTGVCGDFAQLFTDMARVAGIKAQYVSGYVVENQDRLKRSYRIKDMPEVGHAWNKVEIDKRKFFVDTTFMSGASIGNDGRRPTTFRHKRDLRKRKRQNVVNENINDFYFDFTPKQELQKYHRVHIMDKYVR
ncbi:MAG: transglutaminase domain-containing protein [Alphaproteobacteria bacterium]|nr:transglutaminase domain-containing protein [Alphaproteobacteria bacterium]